MFVSSKAPIAFDKTEALAQFFEERDSPGKKENNANA